jgi:hypothetical protein
MNTVNSKFLLMVGFITLVVLTVGCNDESIPAASLEQPDVTDVSANASVSVSDENPGGAGAGEGSLKLIDSDKNSKFLTFAYTPDFWAQQDFEESVAVNAYTVTSGNDAPERDPKAWGLEGSNDGGSTWEMIVTEPEVTFSDRNKVNIYRLDTEATYSSYRLSITEIAGETTLLQISEWRLLHYNN